MSRCFASVLLGLAACAATPGPTTREPWTAAIELPSARLEPGVAAVGQRLILAGGFDTQSGHITTEVHALEMTDDPATWRWQALPLAPVAWTHMNLAGAGVRLYLLGGLEGTEYLARGESYVLDLGAVTTGVPPVWEPIASMPAGEERGAAGIIVSPPHIYLLGGSPTSRPAPQTTPSLTSCLDYNLTTNTWSKLPDLPSPRSHPAAMRMLDGTLIVAGGLATVDASQPLGDVIALPPGATAWEPRDGVMMTPRGGCAYGAAGGQLICAGGEAGTSALADTEAYDPFAQRWRTLPPMPEPRAGTQGVVIGERLFVPGGTPQLAFLPQRTLYVFSLLDTTTARELGSK